VDIKIHRFKYRKISVIGVFLIIIGIVGLLNVFQPTKAESPVTFFSGPVNVSLAINNCSSSSDTLDLSVTPNIVTGGFTSDCQNVSVDTNAPDGYDLSVKAVSTNNTNSLLYKNPTTVSPTPNIPATSNTLSSPAIIQPSTWGFAVRSSNVNLSTSPAANFDSVYTAGNANNRFAGMPTTDTAIYSTNQTPSQIDIFEFYYGAKVTANNLAGLYQTTVTYTVVADYTPEPFEGSGWEKSALAGNENIIPTLKEDMIPVILKDDPNKAWFDYSNKRWATMVVIKPEKIQYYDELPVGTEINNLDILGFFTWIPRYAYKITSGLSTGTAGNIDIVFVDINNKNINNSTVYSKTYPTVSGNAMNDYVVHPSFTDGTANGFANGEWDSELPGYWVAEMTQRFQTQALLKK